MTNGRIHQGGLIPAGAGQTCRGTRSRRQATAHPRGCGADAAGAEANELAGGSSPRVRGRLDTSEVELLVLGLIPAGAGQTAARSSDLIA